MSKLPRRRTSSRKKSVCPDKIGKIIKLLASDKDGEALAAARALKRALAANGMDFHDLAGAVEAGLKPAPPPQRATTWSPPLPNASDWQSLAWWIHWHRQQLCSDQRERVADYLLGQAFQDTDGQCMAWHLDELRGIAASIRRREGAEVAPW
jgi:hypothetical protein